MLNAYIVGCKHEYLHGSKAFENETPEVFVLTKEEYSQKENMFVEPISSAETEDEAKKLAEHIKQIGVQTYLDNIAKAS